MSKEDDIRRGAAADRLLKDSVAIKAFDDVIEDIGGEWLRSRPDDAQGRENCYRMVNAVQRVKAKLEAWASTGLMEEASAEQRKRDALGQAAFN